MVYVYVLEKRRHFVSLKTFYSLELGLAKIRFRSNVFTRFF